MKNTPLRQGRTQGDGSAYHRHFRTSFNAKEYAKIAQVNSELERPSGAKNLTNEYIFLSFFVFENTHVRFLGGEEVKEGAKMVNKSLVLVKEFIK